MKKDYYTKKRIADAFKKLNKTQQIKDITINDIAQAADINRSTFYYHFIDKFDLIQWIFDDDIIKHFVPAAPNEWMGNTLHLLKVFRENQAFYHQTIDMDYIYNFRKFIFDATAETTRIYIDNYLKGRKIDEESESFLIRMNSHAYVETYIDYIMTGAKEDPERLVQRYYDYSEPTLIKAIENTIETATKKGEI